VDDARDRLTVFNSAPWTRSGIVTVPVPSEPGVWKDSRGHAVASQVVGDALWLYVSDAPNMGGRVLQWHRGASGEGQASPFEWDGQRRTLVTPFYTVAWNDHGHIVRLFDRRAQREVLPMGGEANVLEVFEDKPLSFDAWDVDLFHQEKRYVIDTLESVDLVSSGPVAAVLRFRWTYPGATVAQRVIFYAADPRIDFDTDVDWHTHHQLLKVAFPVDVRSPWATYAIQFGHLTRPTHWNTPWDQARFEVVGHQWADLSEHGYGVSLANDCKYGYAIKDGVMRLSLVKSATYPDYAADQGRHHFRYALLPHRGNLVEARAAESAWDLNSPLVAVSGALVPDTRLIWVDGDHVQIDAVKLAEDADELVVRLHEQAGGRTSVVVACERPIVGWQACDVLERPTGEWREGPMLLELKPFEVRTILVRLAQIFQ
jgi:alpha-mannosidase